MCYSSAHRLLDQKEWGFQGPGKKSWCPREGFPKSAISFRKLKVKLLTGGRLLKVGNLLDMEKMSKDQC